MINNRHVYKEKPVIILGISTNMEVSRNRLPVMPRIFSVRIISTPKYRTLSNPTFCKSRDFFMLCDLFTISITATNSRKTAASTINVVELSTSLRNAKIASR